MRRFLGRLLRLALVFGALYVLPSPTATFPVGVRNAVLTFVAVAGIGKILYDTLFFDHFVA